MLVRSLSKALVGKPKLILLLFVVIVALLGSQIPHIYMESDFAGYLPQDNSRIQLWEEIDKEFNIGSSIIIIVNQTNRYKSVTHPDVIEEMYYVEDQINPFPDDRDDVVRVRSFASMVWDYNEGKPESEDEVYNIMGKLSAVKSMENVLYTSDYQHAVMIVQLSPDADFEEVLSRTETAVENEGNDETSMTITGTAAMQKAIQEDSMKNLRLMFPISLLLVAIVIILFYRTPKGVIIAFLPPASALLLTFGTIAVVTPKLTIISVAIVALLMGLGVDYSIHLINRLVEERDVENQATRVEKTLSSTGKAVLLSTVTTMIGFGSLMISSMPPMVTFGFGCTIGILFCFISAIIVTPCLVTLLDFKKKPRLPKWKKSANIIIKHRKRIMAVAVFFVVMSLILLPQVQSDVNYFEMAPEGIPEVEGIFEYSDKFGGGVNFNALVVETSQEGLLQNDTIEAIYNLERKIEEETGAVATSVVDPIKKTTDMIDKLTSEQIKNRLNNLQNILENTTFEIPSLQKTLFNRFAQENLVKENYSKTLILVSIPAGKSIKETEKIVDKIDKIAANADIPHHGEVSQLTGQDAVNVAVNNKLGEEQTRSMAVALLFVLAALIIIFNSAKYAFLTITPVVFILLWEPGFLVMFNIPISVVTISIASIMIGIGIDYGVHLTQRIREQLDEGYSKTVATRNAIEKTGLSLVEATTTTVAGLLAIYVVNIPAMREFGTVVILMTILSCVAAVLLLPFFYSSRFFKTR
ncbi:MAG: MMPL family transporter [Candidatus Thermoplasmatota archaeon]